MEVIHHGNQERRWQPNSSDQWRIISFNCQQHSAGFTVLFRMFVNDRIIDFPPIKNTHFPNLWFLAPPAPKREPADRTYPLLSLALYLKKLLSDLKASKVLIWTELSQKLNFCVLFKKQCGALQRNLICFLLTTTKWVWQGEFFLWTASLKFEMGDDRAQISYYKEGGGGE